MTLLLTIVFLGFFLALLGIGFIVRGAVLKGSCGAAATALGEQSCGSCAKKEADMCPSDDETGLLNLGQISNPHRTLKEKHRDPGFNV